MPTHLWRNLAFLSSAVTAVAVILWVNSFNLEYFPPGLLGFKWHPTHATPQFQFVWLLSTPLTILFIVLARRASREFKHRPLLNLCPNCGYDLRATPDRCPQCATPIHSNINT